MAPIKTIDLTGEHKIPGITCLYYDLDHPSHWMSLLKDIEIYFYGNEEGPQWERIAIAQSVIPFLEKLEIRAQIDLENHISNGTGPLEDWDLITVYFGFVGTEPFNEFSLHFYYLENNGPYYAQYRLNSNDPAQSILVGWSEEGGSYPGWSWPISL